jgi:toxin YhaV
LRTYGSASDAYAVFSSMLSRGDPPDDWNELRKQCVSADALQLIGRTIEDGSE